MNEDIEKIAYRIFATLYTEYGYSESGAWREAYQRANSIINKKINQ